MEVFNREIIDKHQNHKRNDSDSTIASSAAAAYVQQMQQVQQHTSFNNNNQIFPTSNQTNVKVENSDTVHFGTTIINHHYHPIHPNGLNGKERQRSSESYSSLSDSLSDSFEIAKKCFISNDRRKKILIMTITICVVVLIAIIVPITYFALIDNPDNNESTATTDSTTDEHPSVLIISRDEWGAEKPQEGIKKLMHPIKRIIIAHTGGMSCDNLDDCKQLVKEIQQNSGLKDIPYNFLIGGDGKVYEGRGFDYEGEHTANIDATEYNSIGICIAFIGNYQTTPPTEEQMRVFKDFIDHYIPQNISSEEYLIFSQDDLMDKNIKADALKEAFTSFENFLPLQKIYRRKDWSATQRTNAIKFNETKNWVLLTHTGTESCSNLLDCARIAKELQSKAIENGAFDVPYNFLIGDNETVLEGRGWDIQPEFSKDCDSISILIGIIGDFSVIEPSEMITDSILRLMDEAEALGKLKSDYQVTEKQGIEENFMNYVKEFCRYTNETITCN